MKSRFLEARRIGARLLQWWLAELQSCAGDLVGILMPRWRLVMTAYLDKHQLSVFDQAASPLLNLYFTDSSQDLPEKIPEAVAKALEKGNRVRIIVTSTSAYVRHLEMPAVASAHLAAAISLQLPKLLPLPNSELLTDFEIKATDSVRGMLTVEMAALKRSQIDPILARLRGWGLKVASVHLGEPSQVTYRFKFLHGSLLNDGYSLRRSDRWLVVSAAALAILCVSIAAAQTYRGQRAFDVIRDSIGAPAGAALSRRQQLLARLPPLELLSELEAAPSTAALLAELTTLIPQNTWLTTLELKEQHLKIVGLSPNPAAIVKTLSSSAVLNDAELRSSMSAGIGTGLDRFEITSTLKATAR